MDCLTVCLIVDATFLSSFVLLNVTKFVEFL